MEEEYINTEEGTEEGSEATEEITDPTETTNEQQEETQVPEYTEFYSEQLELTNHLIAGQIFFLGLIFGVVLFKVFWDRWKV